MACCGRSAVARGVACSRVPHVTLMRDTGDMKISADFTGLPDDFAKAAAPESRTAGVPVIAFPF